MAFSQIVKTLVQPSIKMITLSDYDTSTEGTPGGVIRQGKRVKLPDDQGPP
jgi:hypothetical protein